MGSNSFPERREVMLALGYVNRFGPPWDEQNSFFLFKNTIIYIQEHKSRLYQGRGGGGGICQTTGQ